MHRSRHRRPDTERCAKTIPFASEITVQQRAVPQAVMMSRYQPVYRAPSDVLSGGVRVAVEVGGQLLDRRGLHRGPERTPKATFVPLRCLRRAL